MPGARAPPNGRRVGAADHPVTANPARFAFPALIVGNLFLAAGPWMVRLADVGPTASAFWRFALALPLLLLLATRGERGGPLDRRLVWAIALGGLFFAIDLVLWHESILHTRLANATLFGNSATLFYPIYGFLIARPATAGTGMALAAPSTGTAPSCWPRTPPPPR